MGLLRLFLALAVVSHHVGPVFGVYAFGGTTAVRTFYLISGFYMSLILSEKYSATADGFRLFITNRALRIFPVYWLTLAAAIALLPSVFTSAVVNGVHLSIGTRLYLWLTNLFIFLQDWAVFLGVRADSGTVFFAPDFGGTPLPLQSFLLIPQAWTLGLELVFYVVAPFILLRPATQVIALIAATFAVRAVIVAGGWYHDPWTYRFLPAELGLFLVGRLIYDRYKQLEARPPSRAMVIGGSALGWGVSLLLQAREIQGAQFAMLAIVAWTLPYLFLLTKSSRFDRIVGELSYPVYITHALVFTLAGQALAQRSPDVVGAATIAITIVAAIVLDISIQRPIDRWRAARVART